MAIPRMTRAEYLAEYGTSGITTWTIRPDEFREELKGRRGRLLRQEMAASPQGAAVRRAIEMAYRKVDWHARPGGDSEADAEAAQWLDGVIADMNIPWPNIINQIMANVLEQGFVLFELVYKLRKGEEGDPPSKYDDRLYGWRKWGLRPAMTLQDWIIADDGGWDGFTQIPVSSDKAIKPVPKEKALLFRLDDRTGSPEGAGGIFDAGYRAYYFVHELEVIEAIIVERMGGVMGITLPEGANTDESDANSDFSKAKEIVVNFRADEQMGLVVPSGFEWRLESPGAGAVNIDPIIRRHEQSFFRSALMQWALLGAGQVGSWALSRDQTDLFMLALNGWLGVIKAVINDVGVPRLFKLNRGLPGFEKMAGMTAYPYLDHAPITKEAVETWARGAALLVGSGFLSPTREDERWARERMGLPELVEREAEAEEAGPRPEVTKEQAISEMREASLMLQRDQGTAQDLVDGGIISEKDAEALVGPSLALFQEAAAKVRTLVQGRVEKAAAGFIPRGADKPLPPIPDEVEITDEDVDNAVRLYNRLLPDLDGVLDARTEQLDTEGIAY